jgi:hypothetical protein
VNLHNKSDTEFSLFVWDCQLPIEIAVPELHVFLAFGDIKLMLRFCNLMIQLFATNLILCVVINRSANDVFDETKIAFRIMQIDITQSLPQNHTNLRVKNENA